MSFLDADRDALMLSRNKTAFVTFDGARAEAFLYERAEGRLAALDGFPMTGPKKPDVERPPGRSFQSFSNARSATETRSDPEKLVERAFVAGVAEALATLRTRKAFDALVVAAAPRALGYWRETVSADLAAAVRKELAKDYAGQGEKALVAVVEEAMLG